MKDHETELRFPLNGVSVSSEISGQKPGTTPDALNCRGKDAIGLRMRGGSRPGFSKDVDDQVDASVDFVIQHLNFIVDPTTEALPQNFDDPEPDWTEHPRIPDNYYPPTGSPVQPNENVTQPNPAIALVQSQLEYVPFNSSSDERTLTYDTPVSNANIMVVIVAMADLQFEVSGATVTVTNSSPASSYTMLGTYSRHTKLSTIGSLSIWIRQASAGSNEDTVRITPNQEVSMAVVLMEYTGMDPSSAFDNFQKTEDSVGASPMVVGPIDVTGDNEAVLAVYMGQLAVDTVTPPAGYTLLESIDGSAGDLDILLYLMHKLNVDTGDDQTVSTIWDGGADEYCAIGVSFKD